MVEFQDGDRPVEIDRDVFELHGCFLARGPRVSFEGRIGCRPPYLIFKARLSMVGDNSNKRKRP
jgi:hypothetical protein